MNESFQEGSTTRSKVESAELKAVMHDLQDQAVATSDIISKALDAAGKKIETSLVRAAQTGEFSFQTMVENILSELARLAVDQLFGDSFSEPQGLGLGALASVIGQRAEGGPVLAGQRYLVGERGPEVFMPSSAGAIQPVANSAPVNVVIYAGSDTTESVRRSERQISAAVARAADAGRSSL